MSSISARMAMWLMMVILAAPPATGQTASLGSRAARTSEDSASSGAGTGTETGAAKAEQPGNVALEEHSLIAVRMEPPKQFRPHDIITIIVRHQKKFEAESELEQRKRLDLESTLDAFTNFTEGGIGAAAFRRGKPSVEYEFRTRLRNQGDNTREDSFVTRISGTIVDVKPNGNLVLQAHSTLIHEEEEAVVTLTGVCRSADVTPDNTILSTQVAELNIEVRNTGAMRDIATRGWLTRLLDVLKPI